MISIQKFVNHYIPSIDQIPNYEYIQYNGLCQIGLQYISKLHIIDKNTPDMLENCKKIFRLIHLAMHLTRKKTKNLKHQLPAFKNKKYLKLRKVTA